MSMIPSSSFPRPNIRMVTMATIYWSVAVVGSDLRILRGGGGSGQEFRNFSRGVLGSKSAGIFIY